MTDAPRETKAEIDAKRAIAAKAWLEGAWSRAAYGLQTREQKLMLQRDADQWAAEEFPYPKVERPRVVAQHGFTYELHNGYNVVGTRVEWARGERAAVINLDLLEALAVFLPRDTLLRIANGPCGPTETVEGE